MTGAAQHPREALTLGKAKALTQKHFPGVEQAIGRFLVLGPIALLALVLSLALMVLLQPWLARYAMARPNARSSHRQPTPQGGGISVVVATFVVAWGAVAASPALLQNEGGHSLR